MGELLWCAAGLERPGDGEGVTPLQPPVQRFTRGDARRATAGWTPQLPNSQDK